MKLQPEHYMMIAAATAGLYIVYSAKQGVAAVGTALNPVNNNNALNQGANALTGHDNKTSSIGSWWHGVLNPDFDNWDPNAPAVKLTPSKATK